LILAIKNLLILFKLLSNYSLKILFLFFLAFVQAILEIVLILFLPLILAMILPETDQLDDILFLKILKDNIFIGDLYSNLLIMTAIVILKTSLMSLIFFYQNKILVELRVNTYSNLLNSYLNKNLSSFNENIINIALRNLTTEVNFIYQRFISNGVGIISDFIMLLFFLIYLLFLDFKSVTILIIVFTIVVLIIKKLTKNFLNKSGSNQLLYDGKWSNTLGDIFSAIKEINIYSLKKNFFHLSKNFIFKATKSHNYIKLVPQVSRQLFELISILFFFTIIIINSTSNSFSLILIAKLAIFVGCFFRLLPTVQRMVVAYQSLVSSNANVKNYFDTINTNLDKKKLSVSIDDKNAKIDFGKKIKIENLYFNYDRLEIIKNLNFEIKSGDRCVILGKTGVGKSTLTDLIMGIIHPSKGKIYFDNVDISGEFEKIKHNFAYVPQEIYLLNDTIKNNIRFFDNKDDDKFLSEILDDLELNNLIDRFDNKDLTVGDNGTLVSGGQKQRIGIARAIYSKKKIIIMDEPSSNLDEKTENKIFDKIFNKYKDQTFIIISHNKDLSLKCSKQITLN